MLLNSVINMQMKKKEGGKYLFTALHKLKELCCLLICITVIATIALS